MASKKGESVDQHFGLADHFLIFSIDTVGRKATFVENRKAMAACIDSCCRGGEVTEPFERVACALSDVSAIFVSRIGEGAAAYMESRGKAVYEAPYPIEPLIGKIINDRLYQCDQWQLPSKI